MLLSNANIYTVLRKMCYVCRCIFAVVCIIHIVKDGIENWNKLVHVTIEAV